MTLRNQVGLEERGARVKMFKDLLGFGKLQQRDLGLWGLEQFERGQGTLKSCHASLAVVSFFTC